MVSLKKMVKLGSESSSSIASHCPRNRRRPRPGTRAIKLAGSRVAVYVNLEYVGDDTKEGCNGSSLLDKNGDVHAFFHYYIADDMYCPIPDLLIGTGQGLNNWIRSTKFGESHLFNLECFLA
jgi:hypothetical protein